MGIKLFSILTLLISFILQGLTRLTLSKRLNFQRINFLNSDSLPNEQWFTQFLDHFHPTEARTWEQRYFMNEVHFEEKGPIFLLLGNDEPADPTKLTNGFFEYLAKKFGAMCIFLEHRYFGISQPTPDTSSKNLVYLNAEQALADVAYFIQEMQLAQNLQPNAKWIVFGNGYSASLAAWMRLKYPHLVHAAVADSAPLIAYADFSEYYSSAESLFSKKSPACNDVLKLSLKEVYELISSLDGQRRLKKLFNLCDVIDPQEVQKNDVASYYMEFLDTIADIALTNYEPTISEACSILLSEKRGAFINRLAAIFDLILEVSNRDCLHLMTYKERIAEFRNSAFNENLEVRQVAQQMCTEFGWFTTTTREPFNSSADSLPMEFFERFCADSFDSRYPQKLYDGIERTNIVYGGRNIADVTSRIVFIYGSDDPWKTFGIMKSKNAEVSVINIENVGHCPLQDPPSKNDSPQLIDAKSKVQSLINSWLEYDNY